jgi:hypothetical protein
VYFGWISYFWGKLERGGNFTPRSKKAIPSRLCVCCIGALCDGRAIQQTIVSGGADEAELDQKSRTLPRGQQGERLWIPPHVYPTNFFFFFFHLKKRKDFRYHRPYAAVTPTSFPASLYFLQPVVVVLRLLDSQISCNIGLSSALLFSATPPLLTLFSSPPTPTIEVVTDDKQIHLSNSICARSLLVHFPSQGYPQPEYRWMKDGSFQTEFSSEPVYKIQSIRREDAGVYQCVARNAVGSIFSEQVQVLVACTSQQYFRIAQTTIVFMNLFFYFSFSLME